MISLAMKIGYHTIVDPLKDHSTESECNHFNSRQNNLI